MKNSKITTLNSNFNATLLCSVQDKYCTIFILTSSLENTTIDISTSIHINLDEFIFSQESKNGI